MEEKTHTAGGAAATKQPQGRALGITLMLTSAASNQGGAAAGALAFPAIGPFGVVAVRQLISAAVLAALARPSFRGLTRREWLPVVGLALTFSVMNLSLYSAVERVGLGLAVTLEFLGPLAVAVCASRRAVDIGGALAAGAGVVLLTNPGPTSDLPGIGLGLIAAAAWAAYILLNRTVGRRLPGLRGTATASVLAAAVWSPLAVLWFLNHPPTLPALGLALVCGILASAVPYAADVITLRRVPTALFGTFMSINPVWAAAAGWVILGQSLDAGELAGIGVIVLSNVLVSRSSGRV
ncbi:EamA family transporter [Arthrobacter sp. ZGTC412]|uniref:EamA family transporter n=1 Tax=Arthrobacter sp. ZGTC412 TaxID=2058900 RepID=UPI0021577DC1|nr:EamA family transporter [Arthrobacter sp. ZGTC412]